MFACLLLALSTMTSSAAPSEETSARGITLRRDVRAGAAAQLRCLGGAVCGTTAEPDSMLCRRTRADSMDSVASSDGDSDWECGAVLPAGVRLGKAEIACGGAGSRFHSASTSAALASTTGTAPATIGGERTGDRGGNRSAATPTTTTAAMAGTTSRTAASQTATQGMMNTSAAFSAPHECRVQYTLLKSLEQGRRTIKTHEQQQQQQLEQSEQSEQSPQGAGPSGFFLAYAIFVALNHGLGELLCRWLGVDSTNSRLCELLWRASVNGALSKPSEKHGSRNFYDTKARHMPAALAAAIADGGTAASKSRSPDGRRSPAGRSKSSMSPAGRKSKRH